jgi:hypothetical protein
VPGPAVGDPGETGGGRGIRHPPGGEDGFDVPDPERPQPDARAARPDRWQEALLVVGAEEDRRAGRRLLERLEQGRLGVLRHPVRRLDDRDARAALDGEQGEVAHEIADPSLAAPTDRDPPTRTGGCQPVEVGMVAVADHPARPAVAARLPAGPPPSEGRRRYERQCGLPTPAIL